MGNQTLIYMKKEDFDHLVERSLEIAEFHHSDIEDAAKAAVMNPWIKRADQEPEIKDDLSERYLAWNGEWMTIINHGWMRTDRSNAWVDSHGLRFEFTHWMPLPEPPAE